MPNQLQSSQRPSRFDSAQPSGAHSEPNSEFENGQAAYNLSKSSEQRIQELQVHGSLLPGILKAKEPRTGNMLPPRRTKMPFRATVEREEADGKSFYMPAPEIMRASNSNTCLG